VDVSRTTITFKTSGADVQSFYWAGSEANLQERITAATQPGNPPTWKFMKFTADDHRVYWINVDFLEFISVGRE
jgi:hypothetical protein